MRGGGVAAGLREWARGSLADVAVVELLVRAFAGRFGLDGCPVRAGRRPGCYSLDPDAIELHAGVLSGGERRLLALVAALAGDHADQAQPVSAEGSRSGERPGALSSLLQAGLRAGRRDRRALSRAGPDCCVRRLALGELLALRRMNVDLEGAVIVVSRSMGQLTNGRLIVGPPKSQAGVRTVTIPAALVEELRDHLRQFVSDERDALVFTGPTGATPKRGNWRNSVKWAASVEAAGLPTGFHFHDLRHTGNHLAALSGASTRELMHRMGHSTMRAALVYQHATDERSRQIADRLSAVIESERPAGFEA